MNPKSTLDVLVGVRARVQQGWCREGREGDAREFMGAFYEVFVQWQLPIDDWMRERHKLFMLFGFYTPETPFEKVKGEPLVVYASAPQRTQDEILAWIDSAIAKL